ncbi:hypothetical protein ANCCEY_12731 [Ancylostoma ceylanicum]|uniref:Uncharacterized protein n=1 Tax=Ancylostoma ceylanicum TaxID=53326 RepID=A0A0D6LKN0_9BILA|nr:hypothetical protein ANCCEY_12731 [Ancylostoma ceylanicum]
MPWGGPAQLGGVTGWRTLCDDDGAGVDSIIVAPLVMTTIADLQTIIHDSDTAEVYATEEISPNHEPILADLDFSENGQYAYVLTPSKELDHLNLQCYR